MSDRHMPSVNYVKRTYRNDVLTSGLVSFQVQVKETDLFIRADRRLESESLSSVYACRASIEEYIRIHPEFSTSFSPIDDDRFAPAVVRDMLRASKEAGVGPMAAVAGAVAEYVGNDILQYSHNVIVENGGDIFLKYTKNDDIVIGIFAGCSPLSGKARLRLRPKDTPYGICTSSGTVGHSFSSGKADAVCVISRSTALADAAATAIGNLVMSEKDIKRALSAGSRISGVEGIVIIIGDKMGAWGKVELGG